MAGFRPKRFLSTTNILFKYEHPEIPADEAEFIVKSPYSDVDIPEMNLADYVWKDVEKWPERTALVRFYFNSYRSLTVIIFKACQRAENS